MAMILESYTVGRCAACGRTIGKGDKFQWGRQRGDRVHVDCRAARPAQPVATPAWSPYQEAIFAEVAGADNLMVEAVAGSGKTSTVEEFCRRIPATLPVKYLVFNKRNAVEAGDRMPAHVDASTFHSSAFQALKGRLGRVTVDGSKTYKLIREMEDSLTISPCERDEYEAALVKLVGLGKNYGIGALTDDTPDAWQGLVDHFGLDVETDDEPRVIDLAGKLLSMSNDRLDTLDFDDMLYQTVRLDVTLPRFPVVCVDEAQDTNPIQRAILHKMIAPGGKLVAVGDAKQAIYGFRGADSDAMSLIEDEFGCRRMSLPVNYRCGRRIIEEAQTYCPEIEAWDGAPEGSVEMVARMTTDDFDAADAVLCRTNAPLIRLAYRLISRGIACHVRGRDVGKGLVAVIKKLQGNAPAAIPLDVLAIRLDTYERVEMKKLVARGEDSKAQALEDKVESIRAAMEALPPTKQDAKCLMEYIDSLFSDSDDGVLTLSTVHKAKGLEWPTVYVLNRSQMPSRWATRAHEVVAENNIIYVAVTRAKNALRYVDLDGIE